MERAWVAMANRLLTRAGLVDSFKRQGDFDEFLLHSIHHDCRSFRLPGTCHAVSFRPRSGTAVNSSNQPFSSDSGIAFRRAAMNSSSRELSQATFLITMRTLGS